MVAAEIPLNCIPGLHISFSQTSAHLQADDDLLQEVQGQVDVLGLAQDGPQHSRLADSLRSRQIHQMHLRAPDHLLPDLPLHPRPLTACPVLAANTSLSRDRLMCLASLRMVPSSLADVLGPCQLYQAHLGAPAHLLPDLPLHPNLLTACTGSAGKPAHAGRHQRMFKQS